GEPDGLPVLPQVGVGDISTGVHGLTAILAALLHRERTGEGQFVETSLLDCYFSYNDMTVHTASLSRGATLPRRNGSHHFGVAPLGVFNGKSCPILIMASTQHQFGYLCQAIGKPELPDDPRFKTNADRMAHVEELKGIIQEWFDSTPDDEIFRLFDEYRVPYAPVLNVEQAIAHPHLRENEIVRPINDRFLGEFDVPGFPLRFSQFERHPTLDAPTLGQHNRSVLSEYLGYSPERIQELEQQGVLRQGPR
ncbi:MAG TPA: CaiB/BaiF CoA-transferase family protein, partial [Candidatus Binataceae bacterium]|nr:CaiB/BaiF CoA-transferase family protein [Candidatus Binataceae bacterium]